MFAACPQKRWEKLPNRASRCCGSSSKPVLTGSRTLASSETKYYTEIKNYSLNSCIQPMSISPYDDITLVLIPDNFETT